MPPSEPLKIASSHATSVKGAEKDREGDKCWCCQKGDIGHGCCFCEIIPTNDKGRETVWCRSHDSIRAPRLLGLEEQIAQIRKIVRHWDTHGNATEALEKIKFILNG